jgi:ubiquinone/menaquinone biosynthesis C-methylase UbiE
VVDVDKGLPFKMNSVEEIYTSHVLEHVDNLEFVMEEIYRVCKPNAKIIIKVPHFSGNSGFFEFHKRFFRYDSFSEFEQRENDMDISNKKMKFKVVKRKLGFLKKWYLFLNYIIEPLINIHPKICIFYEQTFLRNLFPAHEIRFELIVIKN